MITMICSLLIISCLFGIGFWITGALLKACLWMFILLPIGLVIGILGLAFCMTIILIPVGVVLMKTATHIILPV